MTDTPPADGEGPDGAQSGSSPETDPPAGGWRRGRMGWLVLGGLLLLVAGGGYAAAGYFGLIAQGPLAPAAGPQVVYYDLPEMVVNLSASEERAQYLKLRVALEARDPAVLTALEPVMPRVLDMFQLYLRELRTSDLEGSAAVFRLKEELLRRINVEIEPVAVDRVLFKEIIVQ